MRPRRIPKAAFAVLAALLLALGTAGMVSAAQSSANYRQTAHIFSDAGGDMSSASYSVKASAGQPSVIGVSNTSVQIGLQGFYHQIDLTIPSAAPLASPADGTYAAGGHLDFTITFGEAVTVDTSGGAPRIALTIGGVTRYAVYFSGSGTASLVFRYTVQAGETDGDGIAVAGVIDLNGGLIKDAGGNNAALSFTPPSTTGVLVDAVAPTVSAVTLTGGPSQYATSVSYTVTFTRSVTGVDSSDFSLNTTGTASGTVGTLSGSGTSYTVAVANLYGTGTLRLDVANSGTGILDAVGNPLAGGFLSGDIHTMNVGQSLREEHFSFSPTLQRFPVTTIGGSSAPVLFSVKNLGPTGATPGAASLAGPDAGQFSILADGCSGVSLAVNDVCTVSVTFSPTTTGSKGANLLIPTGSSTTPNLIAFLTNHEAAQGQAWRRLPPVTTAIGIPETMTADSLYNLTWALQGYDADYKVKAVFFDCTGIAEADCGANYGDATRFDESGYLSPSIVAAGDWTYNGVAAKKFEYTFPFTPASSRFTAPTTIAVRFYVKSGDDAAAGLEGISLLVPGKIADEYADTSGRRVIKNVVP